MEAAPTTPTDFATGDRADPAPYSAPNVSEALRRRQMAMSRWENEGGSVAPPEQRS